MEEGKKGKERKGRRKGRGEEKKGRRKKERKGRRKGVVRE